jgi:hypothetical protein
MRKAAGLFAALSLFIPVGIWASSPAGSAVKGPTCKTLTAVGKFNPALPKLSSKVVVTSHVTSTGKIGGCTGVPGVTSATTSTPFTYKGNCSTFAGITKGGVTTPGKEVIKWNKGAPSNVTVTTKTLSKPGVQPAILQLTTKVISGQFKGTTSVAKAKGVAAKGACISSTLGTFTVTGTGASTFK